MLSESTALRDKVHENTKYFREKMSTLGFDIPEGSHPIVPVMLYDAKVAQEFAARMLEKGVYVVGFCYPVVPQGKARVRTQISAAHTKEDLDFAIQCFSEVKKEMGIYVGARRRVCPLFAWRTLKPMRPEPEPLFAKRPGPGLFGLLGKRSKGRELSPPFP